MGTRSPLFENISSRNRGSAAVSYGRNQFVVDSVTNGFNLYQLDNGHWKRNFPTGTPTRKLPKCVAFAEDTGVVMGGSDHGAVYVFDKRTGSPLHILRHQEHGMVQTITVSIRIFSRMTYDNVGTDTRPKRPEHDSQRIVHQVRGNLYLRLGAEESSGKTYEANGSLDG